MAGKFALALKTILHIHLRGGAASQPRLVLHSPFVHSHLHRIAFAALLSSLSIPHITTYLPTPSCNSPDFRSYRISSRLYRYLFWFASRPPAHEHEHEHEVQISTGSPEDMGFIDVENHIHVSLISLHIAPSTFFAFAILLFVYLYIIHVRNYPKQRIEYRPQPIAQPVPATNVDDRRVGRPLRRPSFFGGLSSRLRARKQRNPPQPQSIAAPPLWLPFAALRLPFRHGLGDVSIRRQIQPAGMATRRKRQSKQRLLE